MKKLLRWMLYLPTRSGATDVAARYTRYTGRYLWITTLLSLLTSVGLGLIFIFARPDAAHDTRGVMNFMGGVLGWAAAHLNTLLIWALPFAIAYRIWTGRGEIAAAWRELKTIMRAWRDNGGHYGK